ncbi:protein RETARDED ROOT GROWTH-LIKE-like [Zingiber officinale]|uniref:DUF155 domain-containing protein n=1 Tax=Zingiber officinale TaxID=94328 RepID=A0A8J5HN89_ZINOF|nr:protein RETARDED ROOT GROWTH-LIKE-like [Zingiber officinale]KAG6527453.1 hypothetical protein ZIOFF_009555 [Zingiber officinale]
MAMLELCARARHLKSLLSSSSSLALLRPHYALRHGSSEALVHPCRSLSSVSSLFRISRRPLLLLSPFNPHFSSAPSDPAVDFQEDQKPLAPCPAHKEQEGYISEKQSRFIPVKTYFLCTSIDLRGLQAQNAANVVMPSTSRASKCIVLRYYDVGDDAEVMKMDFASESPCHYMLVFYYGSVVLFNVSDHEADSYLKIVKKHASGLLPEMRKDDFAIVEKPTLDTWMQGGLDFIVLKTFNLDGIRIIGSVLSQSIALDYYIRQVDGMVAEFAEINRSMEMIGTCTMKRNQLFQLVWKSNSNLTAVILKLGIFEGSDIAWKNANYAQVWEYLRDEYELTQRFGNLDFKLKYIGNNIHFLQEMLQNRTSVGLEWIIICLIALEILIALL